MAVSHQGSTDCKMKGTALDGSLLGSAIVPDGFASGSFLQRRIEFHPARKVSSTVGSSSGDIKIETLNPNVSGSSQMITGKDKLLVTNAGALVNVIRSDVVEHREHLSDPEIGFRITFRRIGAGLANLGNTCFLNSVLQCLTYTEPFAAYLQSGKHKSSCHTSGFCAMCALQNHVMSALQSSGKILSPSHLVKNLQCISRRFQRSRQEDAHEYMVNLLESMHKCCLPSGVPSESSSAYEKSLVHKIFGGSLRSQVKCTQCSYSSDKFDPFLDLSLEINKADTLQKALKHFTAFEELDGGDRQYQCQRCRQKVRALKRLSIHRAPYVLSIHLKRFGSHVPGQKINKRVAYEPVLNLKPFVSDPNDGNLAYTLYGVLVHNGWSTHSGHYYCYVRTSSGIWHSLNDNKVTTLLRVPSHVSLVLLETINEGNVSQVSEKVVFAQEAYILFYIRNKNSMTKKAVETIAKENNIAQKSVNRGPKISSNDSNQAAGKVPIDYIDVSVKAAPTVSRLQSSGHKELFNPQRLSLDDSKSEHYTLKEPGENHGVDLSTDSDSSSKENKCRMVVENLVISLSNSKKDMLPTNASAKSVFQNVGKDTATSVAQHNPCTARLDYTFKNHFNQKDGIVPNKAADDNRCAMETRNKVQVPTLSALLKPDKDNVLKNGKGLINSSNKRHFIDGPFNNKVLACKESSSSLSNETKTKLKRKLKHPRKKSIHHGPKHQILATLCVRKKKKVKGQRKSCMDGKKYSKSEEAIIASVSHDQGISEIANVIEMQKKCHSNRKKEKSHITNDGCIANEHSMVRNSENDACMVEMGSNQNNIPTDGVVKKSGNVKMSNLMWGLGDSPVPKRNDREPLSSSCHQSAHEPAVSIGYVLDEWDEEYDRGKRKKVKKSFQISNSNPFQIIAQQNVQEKQQQKKLNRSSGNLPFRI